MKKRIKVSDYIMKTLYKNGIKDIFLVSGGGAMHLVDSIGKGPLSYIVNHHEQASGISAEGYARIKNHTSAVCVTSGPGGTNVITGVMCAWLDSIPMIIISGQIRRETIGAGIKKLRQLGDQEINIVDIVKPITKYVVLVNKPEEIRFHLEKALFLAKSGRQGPVWLDIPLDVQGSYIEEKNLKSFQQDSNKLPYKTNKKDLKDLVSKTINKLESAKRPILLVGNGIRFSGASKKLLILLNLLKVPVLTGFAGFDLVSPYNTNFAGRPGTIGQRSANFSLQNSDVLLIIGSRLNIRMIGYNFNSFARDAYKIMVDIDNAELNKKTINIDLKINYNAKDFINEMIVQLKKRKLRVKIPGWKKRIKEWKSKYPVVKNRYWNKTKFVDPYCFIATLSKCLKPTDILVLSDATASICTYQALSFPQGTRILTNSGTAPMGYGLPAAIGACIANNRKKTICIEGDGSIQLNIQELQTAIHNKLPIKLFVYNNEGYQSIRLTQKSMFNGKLVASSKKSGISWPNMKKIANAYGIPIKKIVNHKRMENKIREVFSLPGMIICEIMVSPDQSFIPKASSRKLLDGSIVSRPLEDMAPLLSRKELKKNMLIPLINDK